jgi:hypothetical protein
LQNTRLRDVPLVTLIKDNIPYADVPVLTGKCIQCGSTYYNDHERFKDKNGLWNTCYLGKNYPETPVSPLQPRVPKVLG